MWSKQTNKETFSYLPLLPCPQQYFQKSCCVVVYGSCFTSVSTSAAGPATPPSICFWELYTFKCSHPQSQQQQIRDRALMNDQQWLNGHNWLNSADTQAHTLQQKWKHSYSLFFMLCVYIRDHANYWKASKLIFTFSLVYLTWILGLKSFFSPFFHK